MANLIDHKKWAITGGTRKESTFTLTNGSMKQSIAVPGDETKYKLEFNCLEIVNPKSYFLFKVVTLGGKHTYLVPVNFLGPNSIEIEFVTDIRTMDIALIGSLTVADINFCENGTLTQSQKDSISKVESESEKWDRIVDVTNEQGNLIASRLEGSINNALNSIFGGNGTMEIIDGTIMFRDGATDAASTMAMRINFAGLAIADSKKPDGTWDWKTFGTGQGFTADYMTTGTLSAITIDGVTITATDIVGGKITGAVIDGGTTKEGVIKGYAIEGGTVTGSTVIYSGDVETGNYILISPDNNIEIRKANKKLIDIFGAKGSGGYIKVFNVDGNETLRFWNDINTNYGRISSNNLRFAPSNDMYPNDRNSMFVSFGSGYKYIDIETDLFVSGTINGNTMYSRTISELEVSNMELKQKLVNEGIARSELEVTLMEKGVL